RFSCGLTISVVLYSNTAHFLFILATQILSPGTTYVGLSGGMNETLANVYPVPPWFIITDVTTPFINTAVAEALIPSPLMRTFGGTRYPSPPEITLMFVITPVFNTGTPVATETNLMLLYSINFVKSAYTGTSSSVRGTPSRFTSL